MIRTGATNLTEFDDRINLDSPKFSNLAYKISYERNYLEQVIEYVEDMFDAEIDSEETYFYFIELCLTMDFKGLYNRFKSFKTMCDIAKETIRNDYYVLAPYVEVYEDWDEEGQLVWYAGFWPYIVQRWHPADDTDFYSCFEDTTNLPVLEDSYSHTLSSTKQYGVSTSVDTEGNTIEIKTPIADCYNHVPLAYEGYAGDDYKGRCNGFYNEYLVSNTLSTSWSRPTISFKPCFERCIRVEHFTVKGAITSLKVKSSGSSTSPMLALSIGDLSIPCVSFKNASTSSYITVEQPQNFAFKSNIYAEVMEVQPNMTTSWASVDAMIEVGYQVWGMEYDFNEEDWTPTYTHGRTYLTAEQLCAYNEFTVASIINNGLLAKTTIVCPSRVLPYAPNTAFPDSLYFSGGRLGSSYLNYLFFSCRGFTEKYPSGMCFNGINFTAMNAPTYSSVISGIRTDMIDVGLRKNGDKLEYIEDDVLLNKLIDPYKIYIYEE